MGCNGTKGINGLLNVFEWNNFRRRVYSRSGFEGVTIPAKWRISGGDNTYLALPNPVVVGL